VGPSNIILIKFLNQISAAIFNIGDFVRTIPDTTPGVHPSQSVAVYGRVVLVESQADGFWYKVQSSYTITQLIPENRMVAQSKAIFDNAISQSTLVQHRRMQRSNLSGG